MKLSNYLQDYYSITGKTSDVARQLAFAGIALIWIFKSGDSRTFQIPKDFIYPLGIFCFALACDLLQYIIGSIIWGSFHRYHERKLTDPKEDPDLLAPAWLNWPINTFFMLKLIAVISAYFLLLHYFWSLWMAGLSK